VIRLFHSVALLSLTIIGLNSCAGPKKALSKSATPVGAGVDQKAASSEGAPPVAGGNPPPDPKAARDDYWNLAMQRYKPPASGSQTALAELPEPSTPSTGTAVTPAPTVSTTPSASKPAVSVTPAQDLNPADIPYATWAPGKRGVVKSPFDPSGRLIDVRDFNAGQMSQCPYTGKVFRVPPLK
jgi:hypothetical protein